MRFTLVRSGGFAAVQRPPLVVETSALEKKAARRLQALTEAADFFGLPADLGPKQAVPDALGWELEVTDDGGRTHAVSFGASAAPASLQALLAALREVAAAPAGGGRKAKP